MVWDFSESVCTSESSGSWHVMTERDYLEPARFVERGTLVTESLASSPPSAARLNGITVETSAVFNMANQFSGGKTHSLTADLYHLARHAQKAPSFQGGRSHLDPCGRQLHPQAAAAVFVGKEFDSISGRGGNGEPVRMTPWWGEIAWQLGGYESFRAVEKHDRKFIEPKGDSSAHAAQGEGLPDPQKVATVIFMESNGGQSQNKAEASLPEIRAAVGDPDTNLADVETVLEGLTAACYYLNWDRNRYRFGLRPNLNQILVTRRGAVDLKAIDARVRKTTEDLFREGPKFLDRRFMPDRSNDVPDRAQLTLVVMGLDKTAGEARTRSLMESFVKECGSSGRTFKSSLLFAVPDSATAITTAARDLLAWEDINDDDDTIGQLEESQKRHAVPEPEPREVRPARGHRARTGMCSCSTRATPSRIRISARSTRAWPRRSPT